MLWFTILRLSRELLWNRRGNEPCGVLLVAVCGRAYATRPPLGYVRGRVQATAPYTACICESPVRCGPAVERRTRRGRVRPPRARSRVGDGNADRDTPPCARSSPTPCTRPPRLATLRYNRISIHDHCCMLDLGQRQAFFFSGPDFSFVNRTSTCVKPNRN